MMFNWLKKKDLTKMARRLNTTEIPSFDSYNELNKVARSELEKLKPFELVEMVKNFDKYFKVEENLTLKEKRDKVNLSSADSMINYIMSGEPVFEKKGLVYFLFGEGII